MVAAWNLTGPSPGGYSLCIDERLAHKVVELPVPRTILIVDDEPAILELARMILEDGGYSVAIAKNGVEALQKVESQVPDLILLDLVMPGISGIEVCKILKSRPTTRLTPVVMFTVLGSNTDRKMAETAHCDGYLLKPFTPQALLREAETFLSKNEMSDNRTTSNT